MSDDRISLLADMIRHGLHSATDEGVRPVVEGLFGERFQRPHFEPTLIRDAYGPASAENQDGVPTMLFACVDET